MANPNSPYQPIALPTVNYQNQVDLGSMANYGMAQTPAPAQTLGAMVGSVAGQTAEVAGPGTKGGLWDWFTSKDGIFGSTDAVSGKATGGWAMPALTLAGGLSSFIQGNAAQDIARGQLKEGQRQFDLNYNNQRQTLNTAMEDRQRARVASAGGSGAYESVDSYLARNKV